MRVNKVHQYLDTAITAFGSFYAWLFVTFPSLILLRVTASDAPMEMWQAGIWVLIICQSVTSIALAMFRYLQGDFDKILEPDETTGEATSMGINAWYELTRSYRPSDQELLQKLSKPLWEWAYWDGNWWSGTAAAIAHEMNLKQTYADAPRLAQALREAGCVHPVLSVLHQRPDLIKSGMPIVSPPGI